MLFTLISLICCQYNIQQLNFYKSVNLGPKRQSHKVVFSFLNFISYFLTIIFSIYWTSFIMKPQTDLRSNKSSFFLKSWYEIFATRITAYRIVRLFNLFSLTEYIDLYKCWFKTVALVRWTVVKLNWHLTEKLFAFFTSTVPFIIISKRIQNSRRHFLLIWSWSRFNHN